MPALLNRERAILEFNRRVLAQAQRADVPLLERLRYVCIVSSNMDEFFEVRFADYLEAARRSGSGVSSRDLDSVAGDAHALIDAQYTVFNDHVMPDLQAQGIAILNHADRDEAQRAWVAQFFRSRCGRCSCRLVSTLRIRSRRWPTSRSISSRGLAARMRSSAATR